MSRADESIESSPILPLFPLSGGSSRGSAVLSAVEGLKSVIWWLGQPAVVLSETLDRNLQNSDEDC